MNNGKNVNPSSKEKGRKILAGFLVSAMDMEDEIAGGVYNDYLNRENWPDNLSDESFNEIQQKLKILVDETIQHRQIFSDLFEKKHAHGHASTDKWTRSLFPHHRKRVRSANQG